MFLIYEYYSLRMKYFAETFNDSNRYNLFEKKNHFLNINNIYNNSDFKLFRFFIH